MGPAFATLLQTPPTTFAAGEIVTLYGSNLCSTAASASPTLPDRLAACFVQVDGANIRLYYASAGQINAVLPQSLAAGSHQMVVVRYTDTGYKQMAAQSQPLAFTVDRVAMAFVERTAAGRTLLAAQYLDGGYADSSRPLHASDYVVLYLTGLGRTAQVFADGARPRRRRWNRCRFWREGWRRRFCTPECSPNARVSTRSPCSFPSTRWRRAGR